MAATGRVCTGFSKPYVAVYSNTSGTISYTKGQVLARGVEVSIEPEAGDDNTFYADNVAAEVSPGIFTGGTVTLTVDGLLPAAESLIYGLPEPEPVTVDSASVDVYAYGDAMDIPYCGIGFIARYQSDGVVSYVPIVLTKTRFTVNGTSAATQEDGIDWQTQELSATLMRDDSSSHNWKKVGAGQTTEAAAEAVIKQLLGITAA